MSDFSDVWGVYIALVSLVSILACAVLLYVVGRTRAKSPGDDQTAPQAVGTTGHVWDGDLTEYNYPVPRWWMWLFYLTIVFSLGYLVVYPGLGKIPGAFGWTSSGEYTAEVNDVGTRIQPLYDKYLAMDVKAVANDAQARAMGERLFLNHCAQCHGSDAGGSKGFPSLRDKDWLYGGDPQVIKESISNGRNGIMPAFGSVIGDEGVKNVSHYVRSQSGLIADSLRVQLGKPIFMQTCAACHGVDGKGNPLLGAPNLTDGIWLYGSGEQTVRDTIAKGRGEAAAVTRMPAHKGLLDDGKIQLLTAYVWGLSNVKAASQ